MKLTKKENKQDFEALTFCDNARAHCRDNHVINCVFVTKGRAMATDGHRLHIAWAKDIPDGLYEFSKAKSVITLEPTEGSFPDVNKVLPKTSNHTVTADTKELLQMSKMAKIMMSSNYRGAKLTFNGCLNIEVINPDEGNMTGDVSISNTVTPELAVGINIKYVIDALKGLGKQTTIDLQEGEGKPLIFRDTKRTALVMPMRI